MEVSASIISSLRLYNVISALCLLLIFHISLSSKILVQTLCDICTPNAICNKLSVYDFFIPTTPSFVIDL